jgi:hypothetical protein
LSFQQLRIVPREDRLARMASLLKDFARDVWSEGIGKWSGPLGLVLTVASWFLPSSSVRIAFVVAGVLALFWACLRAWAVERVKNIPRFAISESPPMRRSVQTWHRFEVSNLGVKSITGVRAMLTDFRPLPPGFTGLPVQLRPKDRDSFSPADTFTLGGEGKQQIDLLCVADGFGHFEIEHVVPGASNKIPAGTYEFTIRVTGDDVPSVTNVLTCPPAET